MHSFQELEHDERGKILADLGLQSRSRGFAVGGKTSYFAMVKKILGTSLLGPLINIATAAQCVVKLSTTVSTRKLLIEIRLTSIFQITATADFIINEMTTITIFSAVFRTFQA